jgi:methylated-DNA-[protein]-cysteine S-methyltransferase
LVLGSRLYYFTFETKAGWVGLSGTDEGLLRSTLPQKSEDQACALLGEKVSQSQNSGEHFQKTIEEFQRYFNGDRVDFSAKINLTQATPFLCKAWEFTRKIPYGETCSYGWIARQIDHPLASRAVGNAMKRNPLPIIIPCHRVLGSDRKLHGFGGGLEMKKFLLNLEGVSGFHL